MLDGSLLRTQFASKITSLAPPPKAQGTSRQQALGRIGGTCAGFLGSNKFVVEVATDERALVGALLSLTGLVGDLHAGTDEDADVDVLLCGLEALQQAGQADGDAGGDALLQHLGIPSVIHAASKGQLP